MLYDDVFDVLGNRTRRRILSLIARRPRFKSELSDMLDIGQKAVNEHLSIMEKMGLLDVTEERQKRGAPRKYYVISKRMTMRVNIGPHSFLVSGPEALTKEERKIVRKRLPEVFEYEKKLETMRKLREIKEVSGKIEGKIEEKQYELQYLEKLKKGVFLKLKKEIKALGLSALEEKVLFEFLSGEKKPDEIRKKLELEKKEFEKILSSLEEKGILGFSQ